MLKILGRANSANVQKVLWVCEELGVPFEREDYGGAFGKTKDKAYTDLNPNSVVPTIIDGDFVLWESNACTRYLAAKHGKGSLCPTDPQEYADADRWMDWQQTTVLPFMTPIFWGLVRTAEADRDMALINASIEKGNTVYAILDRRLEGRKFIMGDRLTMADIPVAIQAYRFVTLVKDRPSTPNLDAWMANCRATRGFKKWIDLPLT
ncbi:glutathione S-transferase family protein [Thalassobaculum sp.]|uniref:glutathione S-transferase family protein n=1 Tax=Thalassobaculum sp. TaxID=2022740 RepID=UPI003B5B5CAD